MTKNGPVTRQTNYWILSIYVIIYLEKIILVLAEEKCAII